MSLAAASWIWSVSSIRLRSTWTRSLSFSSSDTLPPLAVMMRARRWSTSVPVMMRPLTMAVALRTLGSLLPKTVTSLGRLSCWDATASSSSPTEWAVAQDSDNPSETVDSKRARAPKPMVRDRRFDRETTGCIVDKTLHTVRRVMRWSAVTRAERGRERRSLYANIAQSQPQLEAVALSRVAGGLIIAPPGQPQRQAVVLIGDAQTVADRLISIGRTERIFL